MRALLRFLAGLVIGSVYLLGSAAVGFILYEEFGWLQPLVIMAMIALLILDVTALLNFPRSINFGLFFPQILAIFALAFFLLREEVALFLSDDFVYRSCVGNPDHVQGASDCGKLLEKLETKGGFVLKEIEGTSGDYWLAEILSYRGRHLIRDGKLEEGKADFARALLLPEGNAVTVNNLAEAGYTRQDLFSGDYDLALGAMADDARCIASSALLNKNEDAVKFSAQVSRQRLRAVNFCRLSIGKDETACEEIVQRKMSSILTLSNRLYTNRPRDEVVRDHARCMQQQTGSSE